MKNSITLPVIIISLTIAFGIICLVVCISNGNAFLIKKKLRIGALLLMLNGVVYSGSAQDSCYLMPAEPRKDIILGPIFGSIRYFNKNQPVTKHDGIPDFDLATVTGNGYSIGLSYEYILGNYWKSISSLLFRLTYKTELGNTEHLVYQDKHRVEDFRSPDGYYILLDNYVYRMDYKISYINFDIFYKQNFYKSYPLGIVAGPVFSFPINSSIKETFSVESPDDSFKLQEPFTEKTTDNGKTLVLQDSDINNLNPIIIFLHTHIQYELNVSTNLIIIPEVGYNYPLMTIQRNIDWKSSSYYFNISILYGFNY